jgi:tRNA A-37 threonylcarbamoyl transferase component Bud32
MEDRYEIRDKVGQGGIGRVHRGYDHKMRREVAIKRILTSIDDPSLEGEATKQLMVEVEALAKLQHPHIITVFDVGNDEEGPYVVMELINGTSLDEIIENGTMIWQDFREVAVQSLEGLVAAHELGMIHSDLKPPNIMLSYLPSGKFQVKILDFGLAVLIHSQSREELKKMDSVFGSIFFMPPEQFERQPLDARSDLYSIGCVYYQALTGIYPFNGTTSDEVMDAHLRHEVTPIHELRKDIPAWACDWVMWLINHNRDYRPVSAQKALSNFLQNDGHARLATSHIVQKPGAAETAAAAMTGTAAQTSRTAETGQSGDPLSRQRVMIRRIAIAAAAVALISIVTVMISKRNERVQRSWAYDQMIASASEKNVTEIPMTADGLQMLFERIAASPPAKAAIATPLRALKIAKSTDGTDIDTAVAKFATTAEMHGDIRQMIFKEVIEARHSLASIPILREYVAKTGKGRDTLEQVEQLNGIQTAPTPANAQTPAKPHVPALRSDPVALSGDSRGKQTPSSPASDPGELLFSENFNRGTHGNGWFVFGGGDGFTYRSDVVPAVGKDGTNAFVLSANAEKYRNYYYGGIGRNSIIKEPWTSLDKLTLQFDLGSLGDEKSHRVSLRLVQGEAAKPTWSAKWVLEISRAIETFNLVLSTGAQTGEFNREQPISLHAITLGNSNFGAAPDIRVLVDNIKTFGRDRKPPPR